MMEFAKKKTAKKTDSAPPSANIVAQFRALATEGADRPGDMSEKVFRLCDELDPANARKVPNFGRNAAREAATAPLKSA